MDDKNLDKSIEENLKVMIEDPVPVDVDKSWEEFEKRLNKAEDKAKQKNVKQRKYLRVLAAVVALVIIVTPMVIPNKVTAFKNNLTQWFSESEDGEAKIITENVNIEVEPGFYEDLTFEEAQSMTIYNMKYPNYLPEDIIIKPKVDITAGEYPHAKSNLIFENGDKSLLIKQENILGENKTNTYVPNNAEIEKIIENDIEFVVIKNNNNYQINWMV